jgi:hypothetical protein
MQTAVRLFALAFLCACGGDDRETPRLILERDPCLGTCPFYRLVIEVDGTVTYAGEGYFNTLNPQPRAFRRDSTRLTARDAESLRTAFDRAWSTWWANQYVPWRRFTCPFSHTEASVLTIVRERTSRSDTLKVYHGCLYVPPRIRQLGIHIDSVVGVKRWLGPAPSQ